jgi:hypothetical protein
MKMKRDAAAPSEWFRQDGLPAAVQRPLAEVFKTPKQ